MKRVAVLVSGGGTNLQALLDAQTAGEMPHARIALVISSKAGVVALQRAAGAKVQSIVLAGGPAADAEEYDHTLLCSLQEHHIDVVVLAGFLRILGPAVLQAYAGRILNVHPSLLPAFGGSGCYGLRVHQAALQRGVKVSGATVHLVTEEVDGGPILMQKAVEVLEDDTPETLQQRILRQAEWVLLPKALEQLCAHLETEDPAPKKGGTT